MEILNYSLWFTLVWWVLLMFLIFVINFKYILKDNMSFDGYWIIFLYPPAIAILLEYLIVRG